MHISNSRPTFWLIFICTLTWTTSASASAIRSQSRNTGRFVGNENIADSVSISIAMPADGGNPRAWPAYNYQLVQDVQPKGNAAAIGSAAAHGKQGAVAIQHSNAIAANWGNAVAKSNAVASSA